MYTVSVCIACFSFYSAGQWGMVPWDHVSFFIIPSCTSFQCLHSSTPVQHSSPLNADTLAITNPCMPCKYGALAIWYCALQVGFQVAVYVNCTPQYHNRNVGHFQYADNYRSTIIIIQCGSSPVQSRGAGAPGAPPPPPPIPTPMFEQDLETLSLGIRTGNISSMQAL